jgi:hypothetical protein
MCNNDIRNTLFLGYLLHVLPRSISLELASPITTLPAPNTDPKKHPIKFAIKIRLFNVFISSQVTLPLKGWGVPRLAAKMVSFRPNLRRKKIKKTGSGTGNVDISAYARSTPRSVFYVP